MRKVLVSVAAAALVLLAAGCGKKGGDTLSEMIVENGGEPQSVDPTKI